MTDALKKYVDTAQYLYNGDGIQVRDFAPVDTYTEGAWVQAWVWVSNEEVNS